jgi:hypothetical protein
MLRLEQGSGWHGQARAVSEGSIREGEYEHASSVKSTSTAVSLATSSSEWLDVVVHTGYLGSGSLIIPLWETEGQVVCV